ncbi:Beta-ketoacyl synthase, N-terminal domain [Flavobacteriaceae bacterium MAR_2010_188]|nr:Beta-ketoacyl synthase, N-terminal domain [Flavobacteriaceae bacterium MAR_2010_188]
MKNCFIHSAICVSAQDSFSTEEFLNQITEFETEKVQAKYPNYKEFFSPIASRRMATGVKMGFAAAKKTLTEADIENPDAILVGTGIGCIEDTEKFLNNILANDEEYLTPTSFIQSTHNTVGAQIALSLNCKGYNNTYVQASNSLESALLDAQMLLSENEAQNVLVGGVDELGAEFIDSVIMMEKKEILPINVPFSEGAAFFLLSNEFKPNSIQLVDVEMIHKIETDKVEERMLAFLTNNNLSSTDIDILVLGKNGDGFDEYYSMLEEGFSDRTLSISYKRLCGEYFTSSGFAMWLGYEILKRQDIPKQLSKGIQTNKPIKTVLIYNQFKGIGHSFTLLSK